MERNAIGKKKFSNGIICIITVQLTIHPCKIWSCCRTDCQGTATTAQIGGCHLYPQSLYLSYLLAVRRTTNMERNAIGKNKFANGIICIIAVQLTIHPCKSWSHYTRTGTPTGDGGGIFFLSFKFLLELVASSIF